MRTSHKLCVLLFVALSSAACGSEKKPKTISRSNDVSPTALDLLKGLPFKPKNPALFSSEVYAESPAHEPAKGHCPGEAAVKQKLEIIMQARGGAQAVAKVDELFDDPEIDRLVINCALRGALLSLLFTPGEAAIEAVRSGVFVAVDFRDDLPQNTPAQVVFVGGKPAVVVNSRYRAEDFRLLAPWIAHEVLHQDAAVTQDEELAASAIDSLLYGWFVLEAPELAHLPTELAQRLNTKLLARINTRDATGGLRLFEAQGNVYPGGKSLANFAAAFGELSGDSTPGNAALDAMLASVTKHQAAGAAFNGATLQLLDAEQALFSADDILALAYILELETGE